MRLLHTLGLLLLLTFSQSLFAASVWQVEKEEIRFYLVGTVHLLSDADYPLPAAFDVAFNASTQLIFETALDELTSPQGTALLMSQNTYPPGKNLQQVLSADIYQQLKQKALARHWPLSSLEQFKPAFAAMMLTTLELQRIGAASAGVDMHYLQLAQQQQKRHSGLETLEAHLAVLTALNTLDADTIISSTLHDLTQIENVLADMKAAWRSGDVKALEALFLTEMRNYPELYDILLKQRNHAWLPLLEAISDSNTMVLVGALHMVGEDGLLQLLADRGYVITQVKE